MNFEIEKHSGIINAVAAAVLCVALYYAQNQWLGLFALILLFPHITLWVSESAPWFFLSAALTVALSFSLFGVEAVFYLVPQITVAGLLGVLIKKKTVIWKEVLFGAVGLALALGGSLALTGLWKQVDVLQALRGQIYAMVEMVFQGTAAGTLSAFTQQLTASLLADAIWRVFPGIFLSVSMALSLGNLLFSHGLLRKTEADVRPLSLSDFRLPKYLGYGVLVCAVAAWLLTRLSGSWAVLGANLNFGLLALLFFNGLGAYDGLLRQWLSGWTRWFFAFVLLVFLQAWALFVTLGGLDIFWDLRSRVLPRMGGVR